MQNIHLVFTRGTPLSLLSQVHYQGLSSTRKILFKGCCGEKVKRFFGMDSIIIHYISLPLWLYILGKTISVTFSCFCKCLFLIKLQRSCTWLFCALFLNYFTCGRPNIVVKKGNWTLISRKSYNVMGRQWDTHLPHVYQLQDGCTVSLLSSNLQSPCGWERTITYCNSNI